MIPEKAKPAGTSGGFREFSVTNWKAHQKNTLQGFLSITLPSGLVINNCMLHEKNASGWIGLPARQYAKDDDSTSYAPLIEFASAEARRRFQTAALEAVDRFVEGNSHD